MSLTRIVKDTTVIPAQAQTLTWCKFSNIFWSLSQDTPVNQIQSATTIILVNDSASWVVLSVRPGSCQSSGGYPLAFSTRGKGALGPLSSAPAGASERETPTSNLTESIAWGGGCVCKVCIWDKLPIRKELFVSYFCNMKRPGVNSTPHLDGILVHCRVTPSIKSTITYLYAWVERGTVKVCNVLPNNTTQCPWLGLKPRLLNQEMGTQTMRPLHFTIFRAFIYYSMHAKSNQQSNYQAK